MNTNTKLTDKFKRSINYLRISVTDRCNLRCVYCMPEEGVMPVEHSTILSYEELLRVVGVAVRLGITKVRVTGGEPLVRRGIVDFIRELSHLEGLTELSLTTNGTLLAPMAQELAEAGLKRVNISLDTLRPEVFKRITRSEGLDKVLAGIDAAIAVGLKPVKINVVAIKGVNDGELLDFADFAATHPVEVRFIEHMPSRSESWDKSRLLSADDILATIATRYELSDELAQPASAAGPSRSFMLPGGGRIGVISPLSNHFCASCNRLRLTAQGKLRGCLFSTNEADLMTPLRDGSDNNELARIMNEAVLDKPKGHSLDDITEATSLQMSRIGG